MVIKMRGHDICGHIIGRMLHRCKGIDGLPQRQDDDAARMLTGGPADSGTAGNDPVDLTVPLTGSPFFIVSFYITERCFIRQSTHCTGPVGLSGTEDDLRILCALD